MTERPDDSHLRLEKRVTDLAVAVVGLRGALEQVGRALRDDVEGLEEEVRVQRVLSRYARRTWFEVIAYVMLFGLQAGGLARSYCDPATPGSIAVPLCDTVFFVTDHGAGTPVWRLLGAALTVCLLVWLGRRSQVPADVLHRVPGGHPQQGRRRG